MDFKLLIMITVLALAGGLSHATSKIVRPKISEQKTAGAATVGHCEIIAHFDRPVHESETFDWKGRPFKDMRVYWLFSIDSVSNEGRATCPTGRNFQLRVHGAQFVRLPDGNDRYIYPTDTTQPASNAAFTLRVTELEVVHPKTRLIRKEWTLIDAPDAMEPR